MTEFKKLTYEGLQVGEEFVSGEQVVMPEDIEAYAFAVDDHHPWFLEDSPFGGAVAHPTFMANQALRLRHNRYVVPAGLHAKMEFEFVEPIRPGARVRSRGRVIDKYVSFIKPVYAGDRLTVHGVIKEKHPEGGATRVVVDVWCENQDGEKTAVGTASGLLAG